MPQENFNKKIKDLFGSMDDFDKGEALSRKEDVWQAVHPYKGKRKDWQWLLFLLLCSLSFGAGWFLKNKYSPPAKSPEMEQQNKVLPTNTNQQPIAQMEKQLHFKEQQLDSLLQINRILSAEITALDNKNKIVSGTDTKINTIYKRDTFYIYEVKIQPQIVERIIRDTILVEVPIIENIQPALIGVTEAALKKNNSNDQTKAINETPSSIQFNFSESNLKNN